jgi:hypothetical protein
MDSTPAMASVARSSVAMLRYRPVWPNAAIEAQSTPPAAPGPSRAPSRRDDRVADDIAAAARPISSPTMPQSAKEAPWRPYSGGWRTRSSPAPTSLSMYSSRRTSPVRRRRPTRRACQASPTASRGLRNLALFGCVLAGDGLERADDRLLQGRSPSLHRQRSRRGSVARLRGSRFPACSGLGRPGFGHMMRAEVHASRNLHAVQHGRPSAPATARAR